MGKKHWIDFFFFFVSSVVALVVVWFCQMESKISKSANSSLSQAPIRRESVDWDELENLLTLDLSLPSSSSTTSATSINKEELELEIDAIFEEIVQEQNDLRKKVLEAQEKLKSTEQIARMDAELHRSSLTHDDFKEVRKKGETDDQLRPEDRKEKSESEKSDQSEGKRDEMKSSTEETRNIEVEQANLVTNSNVGESKTDCQQNERGQNSQNSDQTLVKSKKQHQKKNSTKKKSLISEELTPPNSDQQPHQPPSSQSTQSSQLFPTPENNTDTTTTKKRKNTPELDNSRTPNKDQKDSPSFWLRFLGILFILFLILGIMGVVTFPNSFSLSETESRIELEAEVEVAQFNSQRVPQTEVFEQKGLSFIESQETEMSEQSAKEIDKPESDLMDVNETENWMNETTTFLRTVVPFEIHSQIIPEVNDLGSDGNHLDEMKDEIELENKIEDHPLGGEDADQISELLPTTQFSIQETTVIPLQTTVTTGEEEPCDSDSIATPFEYHEIILHEVTLTFMLVDDPPQSETSEIDLLQSEQIIHEEKLEDNSDRAVISEILSDQQADEEEAALTLDDSGIDMDLDLEIQSSVVSVESIALNKIENCEEVIQSTEEEKQVQEQVEDQVEGQGEADEEDEEQSLSQSLEPEISRNDMNEKEITVNERLESEIDVILPISLPYFSILLAAGLCFFLSILFIRYFILKSSPPTPPPSLLPSTPSFPPSSSTSFPPPSPSPSPSSSSSSESSSPSSASSSSESLPHSLNSSSSSSGDDFSDDENISSSIPKSLPQQSISTLPIIQNIPTKVLFKERKEVEATPDGSRGGYRMKMGEGTNFEKDYRLKNPPISSSNHPSIPLPLLSSNTTKRARKDTKPLTAMTVQEALSFSIATKNNSLQE